LSATAKAIVTAGLRPELFDEDGARFFSRRLLAFTLAALVLAGFAFRIAGSSAEGLSDDELNKLNAVADYRERGLTSINSEHPLLMKALLTISLIGAEKWNATGLVAAHTDTLRVPVESALRLPNALLGAFTALLIYLLAAELFGVEVALIAAALWAFDPSAIGFNRIVKEDTPLLFFFLLANIFWLRGQRVAESGNGRPEPYYWATAAAFGAMLASKYVPVLLAVSFGYYYIFQDIKATRWRLGKRRILIFLLVMGAAFLLCNPTILLPGTWRQMLAFAKGQRVGHDSYEFLGTLYPHKMLDWLKGVPWYFYYVFIAVKLPLLTLFAFLAGLPLLFRRKLGDGRFFLFFWILFAYFPFTLVGSKFTRYFTVSLPIVLITAAIGLKYAGGFLAQWCAALLNSVRFKTHARAAIILLAILSSAWASTGSAPHYRLYSNLIGGERGRAGDYFPHDEFYDSSVREAMFEIARRAGRGVRVASETPNLAAYYAQQANRPDLLCVSLSDAAALREMLPGDFVIAARGRRYFSNDALIGGLRQSSAPAFSVKLGEVPSIDVYALDEAAMSLPAFLRSIN
jgi:hypothetical protein